MPLLDSTTLNRFFNQAEVRLSTEKMWLFDRYSMDVVAGTSEYTLPNYVTGIRRVIWQGWALDPLPMRNFREVFQSATQQGTPFWYVYNNIGANTIKFFPCPETALNQVNTNDLWNASGNNSFEDGVVIEFARASDNSSFVVPTALRRQLLVLWVARQAAAIDGPSSDDKAVAYFDKRWEEKKQWFYDWLDELHNKQRRLLVDEIVSSNYFPAAPVLPISQFGISVDEGY